MLPDGLSAEQPLDTDQLQLVAAGGTRYCYQHPEDPHKCIKVGFNEAGKQASYQEARYYQLINQRAPNLTFESIPSFFGRIATSEGEGFIFELIRDETSGDISQPLVDCLTMESYEQAKENWESALVSFRDWLLANAIITTDMTPLNLCAQKYNSGHIRLVAVDGLGHKDRTPLVDISTLLARMKLQRHFRRRKLTNMQSLLQETEKYAKRKAAGPLYGKYPLPDDYKG